MSIKPKYVTQEQAKWLKEKKYLKKTNFYYNDDCRSILIEAKGSSLGEAWRQYAPEQHQVIDWLWETYLIDISTIPFRERGYKLVQFQFRVINFSDPEIDEVLFEHQYNSSFQKFSSKEEAISAAFYYIKENKII